MVFIHFWNKTFPQTKKKFARFHNHEQQKLKPHKKGFITLA